VLAADQRVTRFVGDGQLWAPLVIQDRVRAALRQEPVEQVGAARWYVAEEGG
jgi:ribosomal-protein-alanine N-acetyltransferase